MTNKQTRERNTLILIVLLFPLLILSGYSTAGILLSQEKINYYNLNIRCSENESEMFIDQNTISRTFYIENNNKDPVILSFITANWNPIEAFNQIEVIWDYDGNPIPPSITCEVLITIVNHSQDELNDFSFNIDFIAYHP